MKQFFILIFSILFALSLSNCASQKRLTREEYLSLRNQYDDLRTRTYKGFTKDEVLDSVDKIFRIADTDYSIAYGEKGCIAHRPWTIYLILSITWGKDYWYISVNEKDDATTVRIREITEVNSLAGTPTGGGGAQATAISSMTNPDIIDQNEMKNKEALYTIFFKRLDFFLGLTDEWIDCKKAKKYVKKYKLKGHIEPFCLLATDDSPASIKDIE